MKILITGGAGYIGCVLTKMLLERGYQVRILDRMYFLESDEFFDDSKGVEYIRNDIRYISLDVMDGIDVVIDLAALSNDPSGELDKYKTYDINYLGRSRIARMAKIRGVKKYILASSCSIYGFTKEIVNEKSTTNPLTTYAKCNELAEKAALELFDEKFSVTCLRQATVFGLSKRMRFDLAINGMVGAYYKYKKLKILKDGNQYRPFVHVKDTARAFLMVLEASNDRVNGEIFNVGSNDLNVSIIDLAKDVCQGINQPFEYEWYGDPDNRSYRANFNKISNVLGFETKMKIHDGAREVYDALKKQDVDFDDPRTITLKWYRHLLENEAENENLVMNGSIL